MFIAIVSITFNFISAKHTQDNKYNIISETDRTCQIDISVEQPIFSMNIFELVKHIKRNSKELIIPEKADINGKEYTVVKITGSTEKKEFESVVLPNSLIEIGDHAFYGCSSLQTINIPNSVKSIADGTFSYCTNLQTVIIPDSVKSIGNWAFYGCTNLQTVIIPNSVKSIGGWAFYGCSSIKEIDIPDSVESIGDGAFYGTPWKKNKQ